MAADSFGDRIHGFIDAKPQELEPPTIAQLKVKGVGKGTASSLRFRDRLPRHPAIPPIPPRNRGDLSRRERSSLAQGWVDRTSRSVPEPTPNRTSEAQRTAQEPIRTNP